MAVRKVISRRSWHFRGFFPSLKNGKSIPFESILESGFLHLLELSPLVISYEVQPMRTSFLVEGVPTTYVPDVLVHLADGRSVICEVKPYQFLNRKGTKARISAARSDFASRDYLFITVDERVIHLEPRRTTVQKVLYYRQGSLGAQKTCDLDLTSIKQSEPASVDHLCADFGEALAWRLIGLGVVGVDLDLPIHGGSKIYLEGGHRHANLFA